MRLNHLRPIFFRVGEHARLFSGWVGEGQVWAVTFEMHEAGRFLMDAEPALAKRLLATEEDENGIGVVPDAITSLRIGERLYFTNGADIYPMGFIEQGERGVVVRNDKATGMVDVFLEVSHEGLEDDENCIMVLPHHDTSLLDLMKPYVEHSHVGNNAEAA